MLSAGTEVPAPRSLAASRRQPFSRPPPAARPLAPGPLLPLPIGFALGGEGALVDGADVRFVVARDHDDAALAHRMAAAVLLVVVPDHGASWDEHVAIHDRLAYARVAS